MVSLQFDSQLLLLTTDYSLFTIHYFFINVCDSSVIQAVISINVFC